MSSSLGQSAAAGDWIAGNSWREKAWEREFLRHGKGPSQRGSTIQRGSVVWWGRELVVGAYRRAARIMDGTSWRHSAAVVLLGSVLLSFLLLDSHHPRYSPLVTVEHVVQLTEAGEHHLERCDFCNGQRVPSVQVRRGNAVMYCSPEHLVHRLIVRGTDFDDTLRVECERGRCPLAGAGRELVWDGGAESTAAGDALHVYYGGSISFHATPYDESSGLLDIVTHGSRLHIAYFDLEPIFLLANNTILAHLEIRESMSTSPLYNITDASVDQFLRISGNLEEHIFPVPETLRIDVLEEDARVELNSMSSFETIIVEGSSLGGGGGFKISNVSSIETLDVSNIENFDWNAVGHIADSLKVHVGHYQMTPDSRLIVDETATDFDVFCVGPPLVIVHVDGTIEAHGSLVQFEGLLEGSEGDDDSPIVEVPGHIICTDACQGVELKARVLDTDAPNGIALNNDRFGRGWIDVDNDGHVLFDSEIVTRESIGVACLLRAGSRITTNTGDITFNCAVTNSSILGSVAAGVGIDTATITSASGSIDIAGIATNGGQIANAASFGGVVITGTTISTGSDIHITGTGDLSLTPGGVLVAATEIDAGGSVTISGTHGNNLGYNTDHDLDHVPHWSCGVIVAENTGNVTSSISSGGSISLIGRSRWPGLMSGSCGVFVGNSELNAALEVTIDAVVSSIGEEYDPLDSFNMLRGIEGYCAHCGVLLFPGAEISATTVNVAGSAGSGTVGHGVMVFGSVSLTCKDLVMDGTGSDVNVLSGLMDPPPSFGVLLRSNGKVLALSATGDVAASGIGGAASNSRGFRAETASINADGDVTITGDFNVARPPLSNVIGVEMVSTVISGTNIAITGRVSVALPVNDHDGLRLDTAFIEASNRVTLIGEAGSTQGRGLSVFETDITAGEIIMNGVGTMTDIALDVAGSVLTTSDLFAFGITEGGVGCSVRDDTRVHAAGRVEFQCMQTMVDDPDDEACGVSTESSQITAESIVLTGQAVSGCGVHTEDVTLDAAEVIFTGIGGESTEYANGVAILADTKILSADSIIVHASGGTCIAGCTDAHAFHCLSPLQLQHGGTLQVMGTAFDTDSNAILLSADCPVTGAGSVELVGDSDAVAIAVHAPIIANGDISVIGRGLTTGICSEGLIMLSDSELSGSRVTIGAHFDWSCPQRIRSISVDGTPITASNGLEIDAGKVRIGEDAKHLLEITSCSLNLSGSASSIAAQVNLQDSRIVVQGTALEFTAHSGTNGNAMIARAGTWDIHSGSIAVSATSSSVGTNVTALEFGVDVMLQSGALLIDVDVPLAAGAVTAVGMKWESCSVIGDGESTVDVDAVVRTGSFARGIDAVNVTISIGSVSLRGSTFDSRTAIGVRLAPVELFASSFVISGAVDVSGFFPRHVAGVELGFGSIGPVNEQPAVGTVIGSIAGVIGTGEATAVYIHDSELTGFADLTVSCDGGNAFVSTGMRAEETTFSGTSIALLAQSALLPFSFTHPSTAISGDSIAVGSDSDIFFLAQVTIAGVVNARRRGTGTVVAAVTSPVPPRLHYLFPVVWDFDSDGAFDDAMGREVETTSSIVSAQVLFFDGTVLDQTEIEVNPIGIEVSCSVGGPYTTTIGTEVTLSEATVSIIGGSTTDVGLIEWDFDGDGAWDDAFVLNPVYDRVDEVGEVEVRMRATALGILATCTGSIAVEPEVVILPPEGNGPSDNSDGMEYEEEEVVVEVDPPRVGDNAPDATPVPAPAAASTATPAPFPMMQLDTIVISSGGTSNENVVMQNTNLLVELVSTTGEAVGSAEVATPQQPVGTVRLNVQTQDPALLPPAPLDSIVLDYTLVDDFGSVVIAEVDATICFKATTSSADDRCLGFLDEESGRWRCEDSCLDESDGFLCGTSRHFTNFAILVSGGAGSSSKCGSKGWGDALVSALAVVAVSMCCLVVIALGFIPATRKFLYGEEGSRVRDARLNARNHSTGSIPVSESDALSVP